MMQMPSFPSVTSSVVRVVQSRPKTVFIVVAGAVLVSYFTWGTSPSLGLTLTVAQQDFVQEVNVSGTVTAAQDVSLGFAANGRIKGVYAKVGQRVGGGTILAETENGDLVAALQQAQANLASLQAGSRPEQVAVAVASVASAQSGLLNALQSAYTAADDAVRNKVDPLFVNPRTQPKLAFTVTNATLALTVERDRQNIESVLGAWALSLAKLPTASASELAVLAAQAQGYLAQVVTLLTDANAALNQAVSDPTTSASTLVTYTSNVGTARTTVNTAATALASASAVLDSAQKSLVLTEAGPTADALAAQQALVSSAAAALAKTRVVAPFEGVVTRLDVKVGEIVSPTTSEIALQTAGVFQVETFIPEVTIADISVGNPATVSLDAYGASTTFDAKVIAVDPAETVKDGVPTYKTTLTFLTSDARIRSGMTANVVIKTATLPQAIVVPASAVAFDRGNPYVSVVVDGKAIRRAVTVGPSPALGQAHLLSGLTSGETILLSPARE